MGNSLFAFFIYMKKYLLAVAAVLLLISAHVVTVNATTLFPSGGGTGTSTAPAKGSLLVGVNSSSYGPLTVGADGTCPVASSGSAFGIAYQTCGGASSGSTTNIFAGNPFINILQVGSNATITPASVLSHANNSSAGGIDFSAATGTNITGVLHSLNISQFTNDSSYATTGAVSLKADKTITILGGGILSGGGDLSANRTISLSTSTLYSQFSATGCATFSTSTGNFNSSACSGGASSTVLAANQIAFGSPSNTVTSSQYFQAYPTGTTNPFESGHTLPQIFLVGDNSSSSNNPFFALRATQLNTSTISTINGTGLDILGGDTNNTSTQGGYVDIVAGCNSDQSLCGETELTTEAGFPFVQLGNNNIAIEGNSVNLNSFGTIGLTNFTANSGISIPNGDMQLNPCSGCSVDITNASNGQFVQLNQNSITSSHTQTFPDAGGTFALGTGSANNVPLWSGTNTLTTSTITSDGSSNIFVSTKFTIGATTTAPQALNIIGASSTTELFIDNGGGSQAMFGFTGGGSNSVTFGTKTNNSITFDANNTPVGQWFPNGDLAIGTTTDNTAKLQVNGSSTIAGKLTITTNGITQSGGTNSIASTTINGNATTTGALAVGTTLNVSSSITQSGGSNTIATTSILGDASTTGNFNAGGTLKASGAIAFSNLGGAPSIGCVQAAAGTGALSNVGSACLTSPVPVANGGTGQTTKAYMDFLGSISMPSTAVSSSLLTIAARETLMFVIQIQGYGGSDVASLRFNSDSGVNYWQRSTADLLGSALTTNTQRPSQTLMELANASSTTNRIVTVICSNHKTTNKVCTMSEMTDTGSAATVGAIDNGGGEWFNTAAQITTVTLTTAGGQTLLASSSIAVYGNNP